MTFINFPFVRGEKLIWRQGLFPGSGEQAIGFAKTKPISWVLQRSKTGNANLLSPLPGGEGWGEGEQQADEI